MMVDKYAVKEYVKNTIGEQYVVPCLGVWNNADDIDYNLLPNQFVLKTNHNSCSTFVIKDKMKYGSFKKVNKELNHLLGKNLFDMLGEWPYKNVPPKVIQKFFLMTTRKQNFKIISGGVLMGSLHLCTNQSNAKRYMRISMI